MPYESRIPQIAARLPPDVEAATIEAAETVVPVAQARAAVQTGRLKAAIHTDVTSDGVWVIAGDHRAWYGHLVEWGTVHTPPNPFLVPALEERREPIVAHVTAALNRVAE